MLSGIDERDLLAETDLSDDVGHQYMTGLGGFADALS
jgi:hypothetical protein